jgi:acyl-CoA synthetase (AMP-forming)/AMP-acid ligase II
MAEVRPTAMVSVPRLFEKIYSRIYDGVHPSPAKKSLPLGGRRSAADMSGPDISEKKPTGLLGLQYRFFDRLVFSKIRERFGGRLRFFICGGAPLDKTINEFMWIIGMPVFNGYGLTETSPAVTLCSMNEIRFDSVGKPCPDRAQTGRRRRTAGQGAAGHAGLLQKRGGHRGDLSGWLAADRRYRHGSTKRALSISSTARRSSSSPPAARISRRSRSKTTSSSTSTSPRPSSSATASPIWSPC